MSALRVLTLTGGGPALNAHLDDLARLRIEVFRDFPYLYNGTLDYERRYLATYLECPRSVVLLVLDGAHVVGASTGLPLADETSEFQRPFVAAGYELSRVFYCGESVLLAPYRGRGLYRRFFAGREQHARALGGFEWMALCAVERPAEHPRRPPGYRPLDAIWQKFGYTKHRNLTTTFEWQDLDEQCPSPKEMVFWLKQL
jgi:GNAT superfamily N-acetyltransferase